jgi:hypothetical protein
MLDSRNSFSKPTRGDPTVESTNLARIEFLRWLSARPRSYAETMEVWRTSCPRLSLWEDALADELIALDGSMVRLTEQGKALLAEA